MKYFSIYVFIIFCSLLMGSCSNKKRTQEEQKKEQFEDAFIKSEKLQEKAAHDSVFAKSKEYASQMEKTSIEMSKKTFNMKENDKLFLEFEVALKALKECTDKIKKNPELSKDNLFMENTQAKIDKVLEYQQSLKKAQLNSIEKKKFYELCHQK